MDTIKIHKIDKCFDFYMDIFNIKNNFRKKIELMIVYLSDENLKQCYVELYGKDNVSIWVD